MAIFVEVRIFGDGLEFLLEAGKLDNINGNTFVFIYMFSKFDIILNLLQLII